jgi:hypothetical protein
MKIALKPLVVFLLITGMFTSAEALAQKVLAGGLRTGDEPRATDAQQSQLEIVVAAHHMQSLAQSQRHSYREFALDSRIYIIPSRAFGDPVERGTAISSENPISSARSTHLQTIASIFNLRDIADGQKACDPAVRNAECALKEGASILAFERAIVTGDSAEVRLRLRTNGVGRPYAKTLSIWIYDLKRTNGIWRVTSVSLSQI